MKKRKIKLDKNSEDWGKKNKWFGSDKEKTYYAFSVHDLLMKNGIDPAAKSYYKIIDGFINHYDENKIMKLTRSQVTLAKKLGVPLKRIMGKTYIERITEI